MLPFLCASKYAQNAGVDGIPVFFSSLLETIYERCAFLHSWSFRMFFEHFSRSTCWWVRVSFFCLFTQELILWYLYGNIFFSVTMKCWAFCPWKQRLDNRTPCVVCTGFKWNVLQDWRVILLIWLRSLSLSLWLLVPYCRLCCSGVVVYHNG